jgi:ComF family protein
MLRPAIFAYRYFWQTVDWIYPPVCAGCGIPGEVWCAACQKSIKKINDNICDRCGYPGKFDLGECPGCDKHDPQYTKIRSCGVYQGSLKEAIHSLKYQSNLALGYFLSEILEAKLRNENWDIDLVVPVPLSKGRQKERGYNQAALLAHPLAKRMDIHYDSRSLTRQKYTESQVHLSAEERSRNMADAFSIKPSVWTGKRVLIIDDVITTGSTINECARAIKEGGAVDVYGLSIARAILHDI